MHKIIVNYYSRIFHRFVLELHTVMILNSQV